MIQRELYMSRIRPFIGKELIKVLTGIRRAGKSVMLELIQQELLHNGIAENQFVHINFEDMRFSHLLTAETLHSYILEKAKNTDGKGSARKTVKWIIGGTGMISVMPVLLLTVHPRGYSR